MTKPLPSAEIRLLRLAEILGVDTGHGWKKRLAKRLNVVPATLQGWCTRNSIPKTAVYAAEKAGILPDRWLTEPLNEPTDEDLGHGSDSSPDAGSYGAPDLSEQQIPQTYHPDEQWYIDAVREILRSGEWGTIIALQSNITQFRDQVRDKSLIRNILAQNRELNERVAELERKERKVYEARGPSQPTEPKDDTRALRIRDDDDIQGSGNG